MGIGVLGPLSVDGAGDPARLGPRDRVLLAAMAVHHGEVLSSERLADALWGDQPPASWSKVVAGCVMRLRRVLGHNAIETTPHGYRLALPAEDIDARRFERLVDRARELLTLGEADRAAHQLGEALALWRGRALVDLDAWEVGRIEAARLEELRLDAEELQVDAALQLGRHRDVLGRAQSLVAEAPLRERRWALLALAQYRAGRQGDALRTLHRARTLLATELGVDPGPDLLRLEREVLNQDPALMALDAPPEPSAECPYLGLLSYDLGDAELYFGRDADVAACLRRLAVEGVVAVVGPSGSGKSSLVRAGLAAALQRDGRRVVVVTPGARPASAVTGVRGGAGGSVLVVDQCEEAVSRCADLGERAHFLDALVTHAEHAPLVVALRADRMGDFSAHPAFARLLERGLHLLSPMGEEDLRASIEGPARLAGLRLEPGLVDLLVREVEGEPGALPLLSHALRQTWERREGRTLTVAGYRESGGIRGAVARSAEEVYERLPAGQRPLLRDLLLRLVAPTPDGEVVPTPLARRTLGADADQEGLVELLVGARIVTSDDGVVELAHESVARAWPRLRGWLDDDVDGQRILRHLAGAADAWEVMGRPDSELYRGARLARALEWRDRAGSRLAAAETAFLDASGVLATREERARRRARMGAGVAALLLVVAVMAGVLAVRESDRADTATDAAAARRLAAAALETEDPVAAMLLAAAAVRVDGSPETQASLLAAITRQPHLVGSGRGETALAAVAVSPDGTVVAAADPFHRTTFHAGATLARLGSHEMAASRVAYRPDGRQVAVASSRLADEGSPQRGGAHLVLLDATTFEPAADQPGGIPGGQDEAWDLDYSTDGRFLAVSFDRFEGADFTSTVAVWDAAAPARPVRLLEPGPVWAMALSPDGGRLYAGTLTPPGITVFDLATGAAVATAALPGTFSPGGPNAGQSHDGLEVSPDGRTLAHLDQRDVVLLDAATLAERGRLEGHTEQVQSIEFSRDGALLASGGDDGAAIVWDAEAGVARERLRGHAGSVAGLAFSADGATLYSVSPDRSLLAWDLRGDRRLLPRLAHLDPGPAALAVAAPRGDAVAYLSPAGAHGWGEVVRFLDVREGRLGPPVETRRGNWGPAWRPPDGERFATVDGEGFVRVWDWRRHTVEAEAKVAGGELSGLSYTRDGRHLLVAAQAGTLRRLDATTLAPAGRPVPLGRPALDAFAGPGDTAFVALVDGTVVGVDLEAGSVTAEHRVDAAWVEPSPDAGRLAVVTTTGRVGLLDLARRDWVLPPTPAHTHAGLRVSWSPGGRVFASSGGDGRVILWDGRTGDRLTSVLPGRPNMATTASFLPDGHRIVVAAADGSVFTWDTRAEQWVRFACAVAGRSLTREEWRRAAGDRPYRPTCPA